MDNWKDCEDFFQEQMDKAAEREKERTYYKGLLNSDNMPSNGVFVFGSNTHGIHGAGAARVAVKEFGAIPGKSIGKQGQCYAIVTKDLEAETHPSISGGLIAEQIADLYMEAIIHPEKDYYITYGECEAPLLCGMSEDDMAYLWAEAVSRRSSLEGVVPPNIIFKKGFWEKVREKIGENKK